jgi:hypothetical protein
MKKLMLLTLTLAVSTASHAKPAPVHDYTKHLAGHHDVPSSGLASVTIENQTDYPIGVMVGWGICESTEFRLAAKQSVKLKKPDGCYATSAWGSLWINGRKIVLDTKYAKITDSMSRQRRWYVTYDAAADKAYLKYGGYWGCIDVWGGCNKWGWRGYDN